MAPQEKRIAIAEACGWGFWDGYLHNAVCQVIQVGTLNESWDRCGDKALSFIPDYLNDLNAMHEAEKVLTKDQVNEYSYQLALSAARTYDYPASYLISSATAAQRADAFLITIGKLKS